jgi:hypothetical protein
MEFVYGGVRACVRKRILMRPCTTQRKSGDGGGVRQCERPVVVIRTLFEQLGLWTIFDELLGQRHGEAIADRAFALIANRLESLTCQFVAKPGWQWLCNTIVSQPFQADVHGLN